MPDELIEASRVDGASTLRTFWSVALPAARPGAAMLGLFTFIATWTNFFWPFIILDPGNPTLPVALQQLQAAYFVDYSLVLNGVVLMAAAPHRPVRLRREAARLRHHARSSQGMTAQTRSPQPLIVPDPGLLVAQSRPVPPDFVLGVATAAYQIEGARHEDGRTDSIWDTFSHTPGAVVDGDTGDVACEHYHRYAADVALMTSLGMQSYRFSTSWARVCPDGGPVNAKGLDFYERLVDSLLESGHRTVADALPLGPAAGPRGPRRVDDRARRVDRFVDYALAVHDRLGDRVRTWTTLNEPFCAAFLGYTAGIARAGPHIARRRARRRPPPDARRTAGSSRSCARATPRSSSA